ncbi:MAG TPA: hypothetical protein VM598_12715 [Bdellovibrionota bacterium]|nr:hypothetical protein [Bdellovibrionota bacterium]
MSSKVTPIKKEDVGNWRVDRDPAEGGRETIDQAMVEKQPDPAANPEDAVADPEGVERHLKLPAA